MAAKRTEKRLQATRKVVRQVVEGREKEGIPAEPLAQAFQYFDLEAEKPEHRELLLQVLANELFAPRKPGRKKGQRVKRKWDKDRKQLLGFYVFVDGLGELRERIRRHRAGDPVAKKVESNGVLAQRIKDQYPENFCDTTVEQIRQNLCTPKGFRSQFTDLSSEEAVQCFFDLMEKLNLVAADKSGSPMERYRRVLKVITQSVL